MFYQLVGSLCKQSFVIKSKHAIRVVGNHKRKYKYNFDEFKISRQPYTQFIKQNKHLLFEFSVVDIFRNLLLAFIKAVIRKAYVYVRFQSKIFLLL